MPRSIALGSPINPNAVNEAPGVPPAAAPAPHAAPAAPAAPAASAAPVAQPIIGALGALAGRAAQARRRIAAQAGSQIAAALRLPPAPLARRARIGDLVYAAGVVAGATGVMVSMLPLFRAGASNGASPGARETQAEVGTGIALSSAGLTLTFVAIGMRVALNRRMDQLLQPYVAPTAPTSPHLANSPHSANSANSPNAQVQPDPSELSDELVQPATPGPAAVAHDIENPSLSAARSRAHADSEDL